MPASDQVIKAGRYQVVPRVLVFAMRTDAVLLIRLLPRPGKQTPWAGRYNGPGGHIERGEDVLSAARRELREETGISADINLCGTVMVDTNQAVGIGLFIFSGMNPVGSPVGSDEGIPEWIPFEKLQDFPLVEDVALFLARIRRQQPGEAPFSARSFYNQNDQLTVEFG